MFIKSLLLLLFSLQAFAEPIITCEMFELSKQTCKCTGLFTGVPIEKTEYIKACTKEYEKRMGKVLPKDYWGKAYWHDKFLPGVLVIE